MHELNHRNAGKGSKPRHKLDDHWRENYESIKGFGAVEFVRLGNNRLRKRYPR